MDNVIDMGKEKSFPLNAELYSDIMKVIESDKFVGKVSLAEAVGVLEIIKSRLLNGEV